MFSSHKAGDLILIIDVQSSIVRTSLVHLQSSSIPNVLYTHNIAIPYKPHAHSSYLIKMSLRAVSEAITDISKHLHVRSSTENIPKKISSVHFVLSSPWIVSQAKTLKQSFKDDTHISKAYIMGMIWEERSKIGGKNNDDIRVIEEKVFDVRLNGYSIASWESKNARELEVSFVVSLAGGRMIDRFIESCDHIVHRSSVQFHSSLFLQHLGIEKVVTKSPSYTLLHIHGELTDVAIIRSHSCTFFGSYPFGVHSIVRTIARETKTDEQSAESIFTMSEQGHLDSLHAKKELAIIDDMNRVWMGEFKKLLKSNSVVETIPNHVIISANSHESFFMNNFKQAYPQISMELLTMDDITAHIKFDAHAERLRLTGLYVLAIHSLEKY